MKEQETDDLERIFRDGLKDLKAEPDAAVWVAIQDAMKKRRRFWLFWSIAGMVAIGLVATLLLQSETKMVSEQGPEVQGSGSKVQGPSSNIQDPRSKFQDPRSKFQDPVTQNPKPITHNPNTQSHPVGNEFFGEPEGPSSVEESPELTAYSVQPAADLQTIASLRIPFFYHIQAPANLILVNAFQPNPKADSTKKGSPWSLSFNPGIVLPSVQSYGKTGTVNYEKTNEFRPGISMSLHLNYAFKQNWIVRTGINWSSYTVSGKHRYFGYTDTVEWIDRDNNTGFLTIQKDRNWAFESRYQWIGIPVELGRRQNFNNGFGWEWTIGGGINYLYSFDALAEGNNYLTGIDESIKRMQVNLSAGFAAYYQFKGPWSTFVNARYYLQPNYLYESEMLREKHQILQFGIGLQYQFKWKGN